MKAKDKRNFYIFTFLFFIFSFSFFIFRFASPAFAQGNCDGVVSPDDTQCAVAAGATCESGYIPDARGTPPDCECECIKSSFAIPRYEEIPEFQKSKFVSEWKNIGAIFSDALKYVYIFAGLGVFIYLIFGGFQLMTSGGDPAGIQAAQGKITHAIIGFIIIFASYWLVQIIEVIFGMTIL